MAPGSALSVVITTYSRRDLLGDCLRSVRAAAGNVNAPVEVLVVDDGNQSAIDELIDELLPEATRLTTGGNMGFAGAAMQGIRRTRGDWIALLNDDIVVDPAAFRSVLHAATSADDVGSIAMQMRFANRPDTINSAGIELDMLLTSCDRLVGAPVDDSEVEPVEVFGASAGAAVYRRAMLDEIGGFDVSFFAYLDDVDVAWRARMHDWRCLYVPRAAVYHRHSATFGHRSGLKHFLTGRNRVRMIAKNADGKHLRRHALGIVLYDLAYVLFVGARDRTLQPARGRLRGLREWRSYRHAGRAHRRPVPLARRRTLRSALARDRVWPGGATR